MQPENNPPAVQSLQLTPKEELAVVCQRLASHAEAAKNEDVKVRLNLAQDLVRQAIHRS